MHNLSIDIETFSSEPLQKTGVYKYVHSPDFQILLFAFSLDGGSPAVIDLAQGETLPPWLLGALVDPECTKRAYNASFEMTCLSRVFGPLAADQWRCTMLHGLYCGYPAGLAAVGQALGLPEDKKKLSAGRYLIRYFSVPCAPTKTNGGRTRNLPHHDQARWELFQQYCQGDVTTEMEVERRLSNFPVPEMVQKQWETDFVINARGVPVDMDLVNGATQMDTNIRRRLMAEAEKLTGLENPNSVAQLTGWLGQETGQDVPNLRKETVSKLLGQDDTDDVTRRALEIRQELGKTSIKKYNALGAAVCADGRVRGLLQFYGANRTGRWAGRLVQVQNLPRTYIEPLPLAREIVKEQREEKLRILYGSVPDTLSQLIRTALTASSAHVLVDVDFASIEARVLAWLAGEQWRMEVFRTHGKIYEASASQMFGVPLELIKKGNPEYALRQKGKVAELALGYQGGPGALISMGALDMGLTEDELPEIVGRWRNANKRIRDLWYSIDAAATTVVQTGAPAGVRGLTLAREIDAANSLDFLTIRLPSGRKLYYAHPQRGVNRWGNPSIAYMGMDQTTKKWTRIETYGGRLVENCTQAIARDCLAEAIERLEAAGYKTIFHVHDEVVLDCPANQADLDRVSAIMSQPMPWAPDLPLNADGWIGDFYRKE